MGGGVSWHNLSWSALSESTHVALGTGGTTTDEHIAPPVLAGPAARSYGKMRGYGAPIGCHYGTNIVDARVIWQRLYDPEPNTDGNGSNYYADFAVALNDGPIDEVIAIYDDRNNEITSITTPYTLDTDLPVLTGSDPKGFLHIYPGTDTQTINSYMDSQTTGPDGTTADNNTPGYRGTAYAVFKKFPLGDQPTVPKLRVKFTVFPATIPGLTPGDEIIETVATGGPYYDANPACVLYHSIGFQLSGIGIDASSILDDALFLSAATRLKYEGLGISIKFNTQDSGLKWRDEVLRHIDGIYDCDLSTGLFGLKLLRASLAADGYATEYVLADQLLCDESVIKSLGYNREDDADNINFWELSYTGLSPKDKSATISYVDRLSIEQIGMVNKGTYEFPGYTNITTAWRGLSRTIYRTGRQLTVGSADFPASYRDLIKRGDVLRVNYAPHNFSNLACRVLTASSGTLEDRSVKVDFIEDVYALDTIDGVATPPKQQPTAPLAQPTVNAVMTGANGITTTRDPLTNTITTTLTPPSVISATSATITPNAGHHFTAGSLTTATLPASAACTAGHTWIDIVVAGAGALKITQNASQQILDPYGNGSTVTTGNITTTSPYFTCRLLYLGADKFLITNVQGSYDWNL